VFQTETRVVADVQAQKISMSAKAKVDEQLATESHQLREQKIHKLRA
jgi:hypothetical protein